MGGPGQVGPQGVSAPAGWPAPPNPQSPKRKGWQLALVLAITLVVVVAAGVAVLLIRNRPDVSSTPTATATTPAVTSPTATATTPAVTSESPSASTNTDDGVRGLKQVWQHPFYMPFDNQWAGDGYTGSWLVSSQVWLFSNSGQISGLDPDTGQTMWNYKPGDCARTLVDGKVACLVTDSSGGSTSSQVCLIEARTGDSQCLDLDGAASMDVWWASLTTGDGSLFLRGQAGTQGVGGSYVFPAALRVDLNPLRVRWATTFGPGYCGAPDSGSDYQKFDEGKASDKGDGLGVNSNVFWFRGALDGGDAYELPFAVDARTGQSLFPSNVCPEIVPLTNDTFLVPAAVNGGRVTLPGGGQVKFVHATGGAIAWGSPAISNYSIADSDTVRPSVPLYYRSVPGTDYWDGQATLGVVSGGSWDVTMKLQHPLAGGGAWYLSGVVAGGNIILASGDGQVVAIDYSTGKVQWSATVPFDESDGVAYTMLAMFILGDSLVVTTMGDGLDDQFRDQTTLLSLATGEVVGTAPGDAIVSRDGTMLGVVNQTDSGLTLTRYVPSDS